MYRVHGILYKPLVYTHLFICKLFSRTIELKTIAQNNSKVVRHNKTFFLEEAKAYLLFLKVSIRLEATSQLPFGDKIRHLFNDVGNAAQII